MSHPFAFAMREAVALAAQSRFATYPNPTVGAVLVQNGRVVARGWHEAYGQAHAEVRCLKDAVSKGVDPTACTMVVTLEPCNHHGQTPPCSHAVVAAGIRHVVVGLRDPHAKAAGGGEYLAAHGVRVEYGVEEQLCRDLIADFICWHTSELPYIMLKMATTIDGRIATRTGHAQWISGEESRAVVHRLRAGIGRCGGAVLIGGGTFRADNPRLTARGEDTPAEAQPLACIITSRLPQRAVDYTLLAERPEQTVFFATPAAAASPAAHALREKGVRVWSVPPATGTQRVDFYELFVRMRNELHCPYILCEGGGSLALSLLEAGLVDVFMLHMAPLILGDADALPLFAGRSPLTMSDALSLRVSEQCMCGGDVHITFRPCRKP